jgi:hypothetical protein
MICQRTNSVRSGFPSPVDEKILLIPRHDELYAALKQFVRGVRIFVLSDSCHSGTVLRAVHFSSLGLKPVRPRMMPRDVALRVYMDHEKFYDKLQQQRSATGRKRMDATAVLISGCQDNQTSADGDRNGLFTETLLAVWKNGKFNGDYHGFHESIVGRRKGKAETSYCY